MKIKDMLGEAFPILEKFAPDIAAGIGGPVGIALSAALPLLGKAFGSGAGDLPGLAAAIVGDPNVQEKLAALNEEHATWMANFTKEFPFPSSAEINIKLNWDHINDH